MEMRFSSKEELFLPDEIKNFQQKGVIKESQYEEGEFISPIFFELKSEDSCTIILNLERLNENMPCLYVFNGDKKIYLDVGDT